jgi:polyisoprenoid-binding protein YceI
MKIKKRMPFYLVCAHIAFAGSFALAAPETYTIDAAHSTVSFKIRHLGISWVTGTFGDFDGTVVFDAEQPRATGIEVEVRAASIDTQNQERDKHLRGADFFNVEAFPAISFKSKSVQKLESDKYQVAGDLSFLGKTKEITVIVQDLGTAKGPKGEHRHGAEAAFAIERGDFGMTYGSPTVGDEVRILAAFSGVKKE